MAQKCGRPGRSSGRAKCSPLSTPPRAPFADIANDLKMTPGRLRGIVQRPHNKMPTAALYREEIADRIAYIESLWEQ